MSDELKTIVLNENYNDNIIMELNNNKQPKIIKNKTMKKINNKTDFNNNNNGDDDFDNDDDNKTKIRKLNNKIAYMKRLKKKREIELMNQNNDIETILKRLSFYDNKITILEYKRNDLRYSYELDL